MFKPIPSASVITATAAKPGLRPSVRKASLRSRTSSSKARQPHASRLVSWSAVALPNCRPPVLGNLGDKLLTPLLRQLVDAAAPLGTGLHPLGRHPALDQDPLQRGIQRALFD